jgi:hypothetical protein
MLFCPGAWLPDRRIRLKIIDKHLMSFCERGAATVRAYPDPGQIFDDRFAHADAGTRYQSVAVGIRHRQDRHAGVVNTGHRLQNAFQLSGRGMGIKETHA